MQVGYCRMVTGIEEGIAATTRSESLMSQIIR